MASTLKHDLDMVKVYVYIENEVPRYSCSPDRQTHRETDPTEFITFPHARMVTRVKCKVSISLNRYLQELFVDLSIQDSNCLDGDTAIYEERFINKQKFVRTSVLLNLQKNEERYDFSGCFSSCDILKLQCHSVIKKL